MLSYTSINDFKVMTNKNSKTYQIDNSILDSLTDSISHDIMTHPVHFNGNLYDRDNLIKWLQISNIDPLTGTEIETGEITLKPNYYCFLLLLCLEKINDNGKDILMFHQPYGTIKDLLDMLEYKFVTHVLNESCENLVGYDKKYVFRSSNDTESDEIEYLEIHFIMNKKIDLFIVYLDMSMFLSQVNFIRVKKDPISEIKNKLSPYHTKLDESLELKISDEYLDLIKKWTSINSIPTNKYTQVYDFFDFDQLRILSGLGEKFELIQFMESNDTLFKKRGNDQINAYYTKYDLNIRTNVRSNIMNMHDEAKKIIDDGKINENVIKKLSGYVNGENYVNSIRSKLIDLKKLFGISSFVEYDDYANDYSFLSVKDKKFIKQSFKRSYFIFTVFENVIFDDCRFEECYFAGIFFDPPSSSDLCQKYGLSQNLIFNDCRIVHCKFYDTDMMDHCVFDKTVFSEDTLENLKKAVINIC